MDDPNITMEEYIRLEEEKARRRGKVYNWETATYGKIWDNEDVHDLGSVETEFPAIVFNDTLTSEAALSCEPTVSSLNNDEIDFRISFDESDDEDCNEDCTVIFDKNSFSYKIIYVNNLKTDSENDNDKVNMPLLPSPEPTVSYFDDLDYFKDFEKEFPAIVYNDAQTSKLNFLTEPTLSPQHIDEFNLKDETSLSECDEEEQNILNFNDLFPFNVVYPDDLKSDKDNDDDKIDIEHSLGDLSVKPLPDEKLGMECVEVFSIYCRDKIAEFIRETIGKFMSSAVWLGGGVPVFKEEDDTVCSAVGSGVPMPRLLAASSLDRHACNFSASSFHGCPVILSAAGVKKVRGAVAEFADRGCGFADEVGNLVSHPNLQLWVEVIEVFKTHVGLCVIIESSIEVVNLKKTEPEL
ncbi:hypothetical protein Tco_1146710 [Tanacetum coccineum]